MPSQQHQPSNFIMSTGKFQKLYLNYIGVYVVTLEDKMACNLLVDIGEDNVVNDSS